MSYRIGLDVSGGDRAPGEIVRGAILAARELKQDIVLIGLKEDFQSEISDNKALAQDFEFVEAKEKIEMAEPPAISVRRKKNSSIVIGCQLLKEKKLDAFVSCGNTGAVVCAATLKSGLIEGIERPGIALLLPTQKGVSLIVDVGANIDPRPLQLLQYGIMASVYYQLVLNHPKPRVGLLNIGEEETKGPDFVKSIHKLFSAAPLNFIGNLEAKDMFSGKCECIVCDGFLGNIALKVSESSSEFMGKFFLKTIKSEFLGRLGLLLMRRGIEKFKRAFDYAEYGGAPLLGIDGIVIIGHGRSNAVAVKNAIKVAVEELKRNLLGEIKKQVNEIYQDDKVVKLLSA